MRRPSHQKKREQERSASSAALAAAPIDVHVPASGPGAGAASIGGAPVVAADGEEIQHAVLRYLHHIALATGHSVRAMVRDERIGFVVPILVSVDGASEFAGEPVRVGTAEAPPSVDRPGEAVVPPADFCSSSAPARSTAPQHPAPVQSAAPVREPAPVQPSAKVHERSSAQRYEPAPAASPVRHPATGEQAPAYRTSSVHEPVAAQPSVPVREPAPARHPAAVQEPDLAQQSAPLPPPPAEETPARPGGTVATFVLRAMPEQEPLIRATSGPAQVLPQGDAVAPGTVSAPTGTFGPPPVITGPGPAPVWRAPENGPDEPKTLRPDVEPEPDSYSALDAKPTPAPRTAPVAKAEEEAKEPPVREFDSVAELVLGAESGTAPADGTGGPIAEPMARINAAVRQGRIEEAAVLAEQTVAEAAATLGFDHPDVLRLRELTAYIAYLAGDPLRSFHLSLELAPIRHRLGDPRGAYGNVQSAAAAWRAVRDPMQGLHLGRDLIAVWTELAADKGPAADDLDQLEKARGRMGRLAERARAATGEHPYRQ